MLNYDSQVKEQIEQFFLPRTKISEDSARVTGFTLTNVIFRISIPILNTALATTLVLPMMYSSCQPAENYSNNQKLQFKNLNQMK
jgi:hypothetical protein